MYDTLWILCIETLLNSIKIEIKEEKKKHAAIGN